MCKKKELRDLLAGALIGLARATEGNDHMVTETTGQMAVDGLKALYQDTDEGTLLALLRRADGEKRKLVPSCYLCEASCGRNNNYDMARLQDLDPALRCLKERLLSAIQAAAAYAYPAQGLYPFLYRGLYAIGAEDWEEADLLPLIQEAEERSSGTNP